MIRSPPFWYFVGKGRETEPYIKGVPEIQWGHAPLSLPLSYNVTPYSAAVSVWGCAIVIPSTCVELISNYYKMELSDLGIWKIKHPLRIWLDSLMLDFGHTSTLLLVYCPIREIAFWWWGGIYIHPTQNWLSILRLYFYIDFYFIVNSDLAQFLHNYFSL